MNAIRNSIDVSGWTFGLNTRPESLFEAVKTQRGPSDLRASASDGRAFAGLDTTPTRIEINNG